MTAQQSVAITGASGFLGRALCERFAKAGFLVRAGIRRPHEFQHGDSRIVPFECDLPDRFDSQVLLGTEFLIHAAYTMRYHTPGQARQTNIRGTARVLKAARRASSRFVFISSCSAHSRAQSLYGRSKYYLETRLDTRQDLIVRPGLILGNGSLFERMVALLEKNKLIPVFDGGKQLLQTIHLEDAVEAIHQAVINRVSGRIVLAEREGILMKDFLREIAKGLGRRPVFIPLPSGPALAAAKLLEQHVTLPVTSENLLGLRGMVYQDPGDIAERLGVRVRSVHESLDDLLTIRNSQDNRDA